VGPAGVLESLPISTEDINVGPAGVWWCVVVQMFNAHSVVWWG
jgi:hypothetical protein